MASACRQRRRLQQFQQNVRRPEQIQWNEQQVHDLHVLTQKQPPVVEVAAKSLAVEEIPDVLFIHRRITVRHLQRLVEHPVHGPEADEIACHRQPDRARELSAAPLDAAARTRQCRQSCQPAGPHDRMPHGQRRGKQH
jgi:hypothetical protein